MIVYLSSLALWHSSTVQFVTENGSRKGTHHLEHSSCTQSLGLQYSQLHLMSLLLHHSAKTTVLSPNSSSSSSGMMAVWEGTAFVLLIPPAPVWIDLAQWSHSGFVLDSKDLF